MDKHESNRNLCDILVDNSYIRRRKRKNFNNVFSILKLHLNSLYYNKISNISIINFYISVSIFMISFFSLASKTFTFVDCLKTRYGK